MYNIVRLRLVNNLPLFMTTGMKDIEINRGDSNNRVILILGPNGSGKTILMSEFTPRHEENIQDRGRFVVIEDEVGMKEIDIKKGEDYLYKCQIVYDKRKTSCFITKVNLMDGTEEELNPNGNVTSYNDILECELNLQKNYTNIGYLSDSVSNFIDMKTAERRSYITTWLPDIMHYLDAFRNLSAKVNLYNRQIKYFNNEMGALNEVELDMKTKNLEDIISKLTIEINEKKKVYDKAETYIDFYKNVEITSISSLVDKKKEEKNSLTNKKEALLDIVENYSRYLKKDGIKELNKDILKLEREILEKQNKLQTIDDALLTKRQEISTQFEEIQRMNDMKEREDWSSFAVDTEKLLSIDIENFERISNKLKSYTSKEHIHPEALNKVYHIFNGFKNLIEYIEETMELFDDRVTFMKLIDDFDNISSKLEKDSDKVMGEFGNLQKRLIEIENTIKTYKSYNLNHEGDVLKKTPEVCSKNTCPVYKKLSTMINPEELLEELREERRKVSKELHKLDDIVDMYDEKRDELDRFKEHWNSLQRLYNSPQLSDDIHELYKLLPEFIGNEVNDIRLLLKNIDKYTIKKNKLEEMISMHVAKETLTTSIKKRQETKSIFENYVQSNNKIENNRIEVKKLNFDRISLVNSLDTLNYELNKLKNIDFKLANFEKNITDMNGSINKHNDALKQLQDLNIQIYIKKHLKDILDTYGENITTLQNELNLSKKELEDLQRRKISIKTLQSSRDKLLEQVKRMTPLVDIWSPKTGIPSDVMNAFLERVKHRTNEYLKKLWNDSLLLYNITVKEKSVPIEILKNNAYILEDAATCSRGEKATLISALSMAMIMESVVSINGYNVLRMDEIDGTFDGIRKRNFIEILLKRLEEINCMNCFVITHNNEFDHIPADVILLKGHDFNRDNLKNKNVLLEIT